MCCRAPSDDGLGWARVAQAIGNFFEDVLSVGIDAYTANDQMSLGDDGNCIIEGWRIVDRSTPEKERSGALFDPQGESGGGARTG